jgi:quinol-cytochrome oxidoreductase complex cytochrome b subunit
MKIGELTNLYVDAKAKLEQERGPAKKQKAVAGIPLKDELIRDSGIISFMMGTIFLMIGIAGPPLHAAYDMTSPPTFVKPDWYLLWSLGPIFLAKWPIIINGVTVVDTKFLGTMLTGVPVIGVMLMPFLAGRSKAKRPVEDPLNVALGVFGLTFVLWMSIVGIADVIFAYEVSPLKGVLHWLTEARVTPTPSELIDILGIVTFWQMGLASWLTYWLFKRHKPRYESKLNQTYEKVR